MAAMDGLDEYVKTSNYLRYLSGQDQEIALLMIEHNYSKPWSWKPETSLAKPTCTLFTNTKLIAYRGAYSPVDEIDIENVELPINTQLPCVPEADECERYAEELRAAPGRVNQTKDDSDDWEARVPRIGWTAEHLRLYTNVVRALHELQLARLALVGRGDEAVQRRLAVDTAARRVRRAMASVTWDLRLTHWLHATLQEHMPTPLLAIYLEVLQTLRAKVPSLVDQMLTLSTYNRLGVPVSEELLQLLQKPWDPAAASIAKHKPRKLPLDPVLVIVPSGIGSHIGHNSRRSRFWVTQLSQLGRVATVSTHAASLTGQSTIENMLDQLLALTRAKIDELKSSLPNRPIVLVGWHVGAAIACQAALMETVAAVVCMGFPLTTLAGHRGQADDAILDLQCPIFFVIGQNTPTSKQGDIEELRERLRVQSGLLVVGAADERLRVSGAKKRSEGLTQSMVDRCILDEVGDFLGRVLTHPTPVPAAPSSPSARPSSVTQATPTIHTVEVTGSRRQSQESSSMDLDTPEAKKARCSTPVTSANVNPTAPKNVYSSAKQDSSLATNRTAAKRVYESSTPHRVMLSSTSSAAEKRAASSTQNSSTLGSRQGQTGITVNIGSLASLSPIGPIRLSAGDSSTDTPTRPVAQTVRTTGVKIPSTPTTQTGITSLSSLLNSSTSKMGTNSILLTSNPGGHIKVLGGEDAATQPRARSLDLSRVTLLTSSTAAKTATASSTSQANVVMVNTKNSSGSGTLLTLPGQNKQVVRQLPPGTTAVAIKTKLDQGSAKSTLLQTTTSSAPIFLSSTTSSTSTTTTASTRPAPSLSPSTILELPIIFAKDGDPDQFTGAAALTAPLPVTISDEMAAITGISMGQKKKSAPR